MTKMEPDQVYIKTEIEDEEYERNYHASQPLLHPLLDHSRETSQPLLDPLMEQAYAHHEDDYTVTVNPESILDNISIKREREEAELEDTCSDICKTPDVDIPGINGLNYQSELLEPHDINQPAESAGISKRKSHSNNRRKRKLKVRRIYPSASNNKEDEEGDSTDSITHNAPIEIKREPDTSLMWSPTDDSHFGNKKVKLEPPDEPPTGFSPDCSFYTDSPNDGMPLLQDDSTRTRDGTEEIRDGSEDYVVMKSEYCPDIEIDNDLLGSSGNIPEKQYGDNCLRTNSDQTDNPLRILKLQRDEKETNGCVPVGNLMSLKHASSSQTSDEMNIKHSLEHVKMKDQKVEQLYQYKDMSNVVQMTKDKMQIAVYNKHVRSMTRLKEKPITNKTGVTRKTWFKDEADGYSKRRSWYEHEVQHMLRRTKEDMKLMETLNTAEKKEVLKVMAGALESMTEKNEENKKREREKIKKQHPGWNTRKKRSLYEEKTLLLKKKTIEDVKLLGNLKSILGTSEKGENSVKENAPVQTPESEETTIIHPNPESEKTNRLRPIYPRAPVAYINGTEINGNRILTVPRKSLYLEKTLALTKRTQEDVAVTKGLVSTHTGTGTEHVEAAEGVHFSDNQDENPTSSIMQLRPESKDAHLKETSSSSLECRPNYKVDGRQLLVNQPSEGKGMDVPEASSISRKGSETNTGKKAGKKKSESKEDTDQERCSNDFKEMSGSEDDSSNAEMKLRSRSVRRLPVDDDEFDTLSERNIGTQTQEEARIFQMKKANPFAKHATYTVSRKSKYEEKAEMLKMNSERDKAFMADANLPVPKEKSWLKERVPGSHYSLSMKMMALKTRHEMATLSKLLPQEKVEAIESNDQAKSIKKSFSGDMSYNDMVKLLYPDTKVVLVNYHANQPKKPTLVKELSDGNIQIVSTGPHLPSNNTDITSEKTKPLQHNKDEEVICSECGEEFQSTVHLQHHKQMSHGSQTIFVKSEVKDPKFENSPRENSNVSSNTVATIEIYKDEDGNYLHKGKFLDNGGAYIDKEHHQNFIRDADGNKILQDSTKDTDDKSVAEMPGDIVLGTKPAGEEERMQGCDRGSTKRTLRNIKEEKL